MSFRFRTKFSNFKTLLCSVVFVMVFVSVYLLNQGPGAIQTPRPLPIATYHGKGFLINTSGCQIFDLDPYDKAVVKHFQQIIEPVICPQRIVTADGRYLNMKVLPERRSWFWSPVRSSESEEIDCCWRVIKRVQQDPKNYDWESDRTSTISDECRKLIPGFPVLINDSYVRVDCTARNQWTWSKTESDYFEFIQPPEVLSMDAHRKVQRWEADKDGPRPPSIVMLGLDATSRLQGIRALAHTRRLLLQNDFVELLGYTKVGYNTLPNAMAFMTGQKMLDGDNFDCKPGKEVKFDDCPIIWKNFSRHGYLTAFFEDYDTAGIFNYLNPGFVEQPTDYYSHPVYATIKKLGVGAAETGRCLQGGLNNTVFVLNKMLEVLALSTARKYPSFTFTWLTGPNHDDMNVLKNEDFAFRDFFQTILTSPKYDFDNTILFFIGDHGFRGDEYRETFHGFYEDSLPMFYVRLPPQVKKRFPKWHHQLHENSKKLTSPFDIHEMLTDFLQLSSPEAETNQSSIIRDTPFYSLVTSEVPETRICADAGVQTTDCMCGAHGTLQSDSGESAEEKLTRLNKFVLNYLNQVILREAIADNICERLSWSSNLYGRTFLETGTATGGRRIFQVAGEANPSKATFEAFLHEFDNGSVVIEGDVFRLNRFRGQSDCVSSKVLEKYCYCTNLSKSWYKFR